MQCKLCKADFDPSKDEDICPACETKLKSAAVDSSGALDKALSGVNAPSAKSTEDHPRPAGKQIWRTNSKEALTTSWPMSVALHPSGDLLVLDEPDEYRILRLNRSGQFIGSLLDIPIESEPGGVEDPQGLAVDGQGQLYIPDAGNDRISIWTGNGEFLRWVGSSGNRPGQFAHPMDVEVDDDSFLYVADTFNRRIQKVSTDGLVSLVVSKLGKWGSFAEPVAIAVDSEGRIYVADADRNSIFLLDPEGTPVRRLPDSDSDVSFQKPGDIKLLATGGFLVSDRSNLRIRRFDSEWNLAGEIDLSHEGEDIADGGDIAVMNGYVVIPDRFNDLVYCMAFEK